MRTCLRLVLLLLPFLLLARPGAAQEQRYELSSFDVTIRVQPDGHYAVTEEITYDFQQGTFSYAYRAIDDGDAAAVRDVRVTSPDTAIDSLTRAEDDGDVRIRWEYPERQAPATFRVEYTLTEALLERGEAGAPRGQDERAGISRRRAPRGPHRPGQPAP